jgi:hypothetical protein
MHLGGLAVGRIRIFERRKLRMIYGSVKDNGMWRTRYGSEPCMVYNELDIVKLVKV